MLLDFGLMSGEARGIFMCFDYVIIRCIFVDMFICIPTFDRCRAGPDAGHYSMSGAAR